MSHEFRHSIRRIDLQRTAESFNLIGAPLRTLIEQIDPEAVLQARRNPPGLVGKGQCPKTTSRSSRPSRYTYRRLISPRCTTDASPILTPTVGEVLEVKFPPDPYLQHASMSKHTAQKSCAAPYGKDKLCLLEHQVTEGLVACQQRHAQPQLQAGRHLPKKQKAVNLGGGWAPSNVILSS